MRDRCAERTSFQFERCAVIDRTYTYKLLSPADDAGLGELSVAGD